MKKPLILALVGAMALSACVDPNAYPGNPNARAQGGAALGGIAGAVIGASTGSRRDQLGRAVIGGVLGAAAGGIVGNALDQQAAQLRQSITTPGVTVTNMGSYLLVNVPDGLLFATNSATLNPMLMGDMQAIASSLMQYQQSRVEVVGHTDNTGSADYNQRLSLRRAETVVFALANAGVPQWRMVAVGRGEDQPVASNITPEGRAQNRRVEIIIRPN